MAFSKKQVEDRKTWLSNYVPGTYLDQRNPLIPYKEFIHKVITCSGPYAPSLLITGHRLHLPHLVTPAVKFRPQCVLIALRSCSRPNPARHARVL